MLELCKSSPDKDLSVLVGVPVLLTACHHVCIYTLGPVYVQGQKCLQQESEVALGSGNAPHSHKGDSNMEVRVFACPAHVQSPSPSDFCSAES